MALTTVPASLSATALTLTTAAQPNITSVGTLTGLTVSGNIAGTLTTAAQPNITSLGTLTTLTVDDITINGSTISDAADFLLDVGGDISLDADGGDIRLLDGGTQFGKFTRDGGDFLISSSENDKDIKFAGADGGANITALTLDMSEAGAATFNSTVATGGNLTVNGNTNLTGNLTVDSTTLYVDSSNNNVGIGTTSPSFTAVSGSTSQKGLHIQNSGNDTSAHLKLTGHNNTGTPGQATDFEIIHRGDALQTIFRHGAADVLTLDSSGRFKIGTGSYANSQYYAKDVVINAANEGGLTIANSSNQHGSYIMFADGVSSGSEQYAGYIEYNHNVDRMRVKSNGTFQIYATGFGQDAFLVRSNGNISLHGPSNDDIGSSPGIVFTANNQVRVGGNDGTNMYTGYQLLLDRMNTPGDGPQIVLSRNGYFKAAIGGIQGASGNSTSAEGHLAFYTATTSAFNERMRIHSDGKVDIKNAGTDKIVRFINTGSGTQGVTIGTTTSNSAGTGLHVGHNGTKAFLHPYNYTAGGYQQMEIACSDFVLKVNGSASGMTMNASAVATFYGDIKINDANDRLIMNGVAREAKGGYIQGNQTVSYTINHTSQSTFHVRCGFNHYGLLSYGCVLDQIFANGPGGITSATATISSTTGPGGGWSVSRVDSQNVTVSKSAGNYAGGGYYYIIVEGANL